jgi:alkanesulfonate monooxygenase SsuD/methylene tetrahydromethanopterin reductase-like flavin-dependent oxidoreductase (luciferase family)
MSSESALQAAHLGLPMMAFSIKAREQEKAEFEDYRTAFKTIHGSEPPRPMLADLMYCDSDPDRARDYARRYCGGYLHSVMSHYEMMGDHFDKVGGYDAYGQNAKIFKEMGMEEFVKLYVGLQSWGTPDQMLRKFEARRKLFGDFGILGIFRYAGLPFEDAQKSQELFSQEVLPVLKSWEAQDAA